MKYVYILTHSETGYYVEQTYVSICSLRHITPSAYISLLVDDRTAIIQGNAFIDFIKALVNEYKIIPLAKDMPAVARSRFLKTSMRQHIEGDFLYIDADTIWASPINESDFTSDIMGVLDGHILLNQNPTKNHIESILKKVNCIPTTNYYTNSGVLFSRDSDFSRSFFKQWHEKWVQTSRSGNFVDQPSLNYTISKSIINKDFLLPGEYNCQISNSWDFFFKAKIIHYFSSCSLDDIVFRSPYILQQQSFWKEFKSNYTESYLDAIITAPLTLFENGIMIKSAAERNFEKTKIYEFAKDLYTRKIQGKKSRLDLIEKLLTFFIKKTN